MTWLSQWLLINVGGFALIFALARVVWRHNRRKAAELADQLKSEASARGWQVESEMRADHIRVVRWRGRDFDVQWIGEDMYRKRGQRPNRQVMELTRWQTVDWRGPTGAILLTGFPEATKVPRSQPTDGGVLQSLAVKAAFFALDKGIDMYFGVGIGNEIDASTLHRLEEFEPQFDGYAVFAEVPHQAATVLRGGVDKAIAATIDARPEAMTGYRRPWILIWKHGVVLGRIGPTRTAAELEPLVKAGAAITRAVSQS